MMDKTSFRGITMVNKPPRPPCWRDFVVDKENLCTRHRYSHSAISKCLTFTEYRKLSQSPSEDRKSGSKPLPSSSRSHSHTRKKSKRRLHRTSSQLNIEQSDLPKKEDLIKALGDTKPKEIRLHKRVVDARIYLDENMRKCAAWLAEVQAGEPLEDLAFAQGSGVDVEVPDDCCCTIHSQQNSSASGSDEADKPLQCLHSPSTWSPGGAQPRVIVARSGKNSSHDCTYHAKFKKHGRCGPDKENQV